MCFVATGQRESLHSQSCNGCCGAKRVWNNTHPAYSADLAPSDFFLFPNLKKNIRGRHFLSDEEVVTAVEEWVNGKYPDFFSSGLVALKHGWSKCITLEGNYTEKEEV